MNTNDYWKDRQQATLAAKVRGQNRINEIANEYERNLRDYFAHFIGWPVVKNGGQLTARIKKAMPQPPLACRCWHVVSAYSLGWECDVTEANSDHTVVYCKAHISVGELQNHILTKIHGDPHTRRTDYSVEEVRSNRENYRAAREAASEAQSKLSPFGEYDQ